MSTKLELIAAVDAELGIGRDGTLPWHLPRDMAHFRQLTTATEDPARRNAVLMGRQTWLSIPPRYRPLPGRLNAVLTRTPPERFTLPDAVVRATSLEALLATLDARAASLERIFVGGGESVFAEALAHPRLGCIHLTRIEATFDCDVFFPLDPASHPERFECVERSPVLHHDGLAFHFERWLPRGAV